MPILSDQDLFVFLTAIVTHHSNVSFKPKSNLRLYGTQCSLIETALTISVIKNYYLSSYLFRFSKKSEVIGQIVSN